jgi:hypothetical protein
MRAYIYKDVGPAARFATDRASEVQSAHRKRQELVFTQVLGTGLEGFEFDSGRPARNVGAPVPAKRENEWSRGRGEPPLVRNPKIKDQAFAFCVPGEGRC